MTEDRRIADRRRRPRAASADPAPSQALVPAPPAQDETPAPPAGAAAFAAQMLGQDGQKRGLRGGPETLDKARSTYLGAEWSGPADRRPRPGRVTKTDI
jgi:hypothetical protein